MKLIQAFVETASKTPKKIALISEKNQLTFEDLLYLIEAMDRQLLGRGVQEGATVAVRTGRGEFDLALALLQSYRGFHMIFASAEQLAGSGVEYDHFVTTVDAGADKTIVISENWFATMGSGKRPRFDKPTALMGSMTHTSSGSTGRPKFIRSDEEPNSHSILVDYPRLHSTTAETRLMTTLPLTMSWGMKVSLRVLCQGGSVVSLGEKREAVLQYIDLYGVDWLLTTPVILQRFVELPEAKAFLWPVKYIQIGGAFASAELLEAFTKRYDIPACVGYGATEIGGICDAIYSRETKFDAGYIGKFYRTDVEIAFFDEELNHLPDASEGIVGFRHMHPETLPYYIGNNADDAKSGFINGYFFPGDIMRREGDELFISGRLKNIINVGGNKVSLELVQSVLGKAMPFCQWAPLAIEDKFGIDQLVLFYVSQVETTLEEVNTALAARNLPIWGSDLIKLESFPLTDRTNIDTEALRASYVPSGRDGATE